ncbi:hypothetical protein BH11ARM1_BH11ARM1_12060 [soil metagenome]
MIIQRPTPNSGTLFRSKTRTLETTMTLSQSLDQVFAFFSDPSNLQKLTPEGLDFQIVTPSPIDLREGAIIDYRLKLLGIPFGWKTEIRVWEPPNCFVDFQLKGPYQLWNHEHRFEAIEGGTLMTDHLTYRVFGGILENLVHALFVGPRVKEIFTYRTKAMNEIFG